MRSGGPGQSGFQRELNGLIADPLRSMTEEADVASTRRGHSPTQSEVVVAGVHANQRGEARISERAGSLNGSRSGKQYEGVMVGTGAQAVGLHLTQTPVSGDVSPATGESSRIGVGRGATVRRLTPTECERLQGFPDGWTSGQPDSRRYSQLGNAVAVPVVQWIVKRLDATQKEEE